MTNRRSGQARRGKHAAPTLDGYLRRRRRVRAGVSVAAVVVLVALMVIDRRGWLLYDGAVLGRYDDRAFLVEYVIDGDTLIVRAPDGDSATTRVRLWGVDSPEVADPTHGRPRSEPWAEAARDRARELVDGRRVTLDLEPHQTRDRYGRLLAYVRMPDGQWLNERLLVEGLAVAVDAWPHRWTHRYQALEDQARRRHTGLWSAQD